MERTIYTREDCGCYGDGSYGDGHVSERALSLAYACGWASNLDDGDPITDEVYQDAAEDALSYLNENCVEAGISFQFVDGDLLLIADDEAE